MVLVGGGGRGVGGAYIASQTTQLYMKRFNNIEPPIFVLSCVLSF